MPKPQQPRIHDCIHRTGHYSGVGYGSGGMECGSKEEGHPTFCKYQHAERIEACKYAKKREDKIYAR